MNYLEHTKEILERCYELNYVCSYSNRCKVEIEMCLYCEVIKESDRIMQNSTELSGEAE